MFQIELFCSVPFHKVSRSGDRRERLLQRIWQWERTFANTFSWEIAELRMYFLDTHSITTYKIAWFFFRGLHTIAHPGRIERIPRASGAELPQKEIHIVKYDIMATRPSGNKLGVTVWPHEFAVIAVRVAAQHRTKDDVALMLPGKNDRAPWIDCRKTLVAWWSIPIDSRLILDSPRLCLAHSVICSELPIKTC
jgi:hypothetical protein